MLFPIYLLSTLYFGGRIASGWGLGMVVKEGLVGPARYLLTVRRLERSPLEGHRGGGSCGGQHPLSGRDHFSPDTRLEGPMESRF